ncbi:MAG: hypothetical protein K0S97_2283 [Chloroflexota bacterium]|nr:hypothetical protein [Chloroflexota bacterium]
MDVGLLMLVGGFGAGVFGSWLGLGGGTLIVPLLTLVFGLDLRTAVGVSLVCVIMTSSAAAGVYLERHVANLRLGMSLELFTAIGALIGGSIAFLVDERFLSVLFAGLLGYVAFSMARARSPEAVIEDAGAGAAGLTRPERPTLLAEHAAAPAGRRAAMLASVAGPDYAVRNLGRGVLGSAGAGVASALLGIGGGTVKVPLMHLAMGVPLRVATATSNLMMGITAAAGAVIYLLRGEIDPYVAGPTAIGVFLGATLGSRVAHRIGLRYLRLLFVVVMVYTAIQMLLRAVS